MDISENTDFYQITEFVIDEQSLFCIWYSNEKEGFVSEDRHICVFNGFGQAKSFADSRSLTLPNEIMTYYFDEIQKWVDSADKEVDCAEVLNFWNAIQDIAASTDFVFLGDKRSKAIDKIYNKLFCGNNVLIDNEEDKYYPSWSKRELAIIKKVLLNGADVLKKAIQASVYCDQAEK